MNSLYNFLELNAMYVVLFITLIIWTGIFLYLFKIDRKISRIEKENKEFLK
ncbi:MAG TPA: CcmD family protein [Ignavibacteria bacterium]